MSTAGSVTRLIHGLRSTNPAKRNEAASQVWKRFFPRLLELAQQHLDSRIRQVEDGEDVAQSMFKSFFIRMKQGRFELGDRDDLWALLVKMTLNKTRTVGRRHTQDCRDIRRVKRWNVNEEDDSFAPPWAFEQMKAREPSPAEAVALTEELERSLASLSEPLRKIALLLLAGYTNEEIADLLKYSRRTIERKRGMIRDRWTRISRGTAGAVQLEARARGVRLIDGNYVSP